MLRIQKWTLNPFQENTYGVHDDKGNAIEEVSYRADGKLAKKTIRKYDEKGNVTENANYKSDGGLMNKYIYKIEFLYSLKFYEEIFHIIIDLFPENYVFNNFIYLSSNQINKITFNI